MPSPSRQKSPPPFDLARLRGELRPLGLYWYPRLRSTNDQAARLRKMGELYAPATVLTGRQVAGRGRGAHRWWSSPGSLTVTFALPIDAELAPHHLPLLAGMATRRTLAELSGLDNLTVKWPNDIQWEGRKVAGLLCERIHRVDLVGIGVNLNNDPAEAPSDLRGRVTSLWAVLGRWLDPTTATVLLGQRLWEMASQRAVQPFAALLREYDQHHVLVGRDVSVRTGANEPLIRGRCEGIDSMGRLMVATEQRMHRLVSGHVEAL